MRNVNSKDAFIAGGHVMGLPNLGWINQDASQETDKKSLPPEIAYHPDGKTPRTVKEFYPDGSVKNHKEYDKDGHLTSEEEHWPPKEGQEQGDIKDRKEYHYDEKGKNTGSQTETYDKEGRIIRRDTTGPDGNRVTRYDPENGQKIDDSQYHSNGRTKQVDNYDREGRLKDSKEWDEDGRVRKETNVDDKGDKKVKEYNPDGSVKSDASLDRNNNGTTRQYRGDGSLESESEKTPGGTDTKNFREDGTLERETKTGGGAGNIQQREYQGDGKTPKSETEYRDGMKSHEKEYHENGNPKSENDYHPDGTLKRSQEYNEDGSIKSDTGDLPAGRYGAGDGGIIDYGE
ncbi:MAG: hypothetical protein HY447_01040 [Candidatus Omnitrophica bacterium]|nr:hypothetical protein [Candidatus Omnitrophota bacterium]